MEPGVLAQVTGGVQALTSIAGGIAGNRQASRNAAITRQIGEINAKEARRESRRLAGAQIATAGASGVDPTTGSALDLVLFTTAEGEKQALREKFVFDASAAAQEAQGRALLASGISGAAGTLLGGAQRALGIVEEEEFRRRVLRGTSTPVDQIEFDTFGE